MTENDMPDVGGRRFRLGPVIAGLVLLGVLVLVIVFALSVFQDASATGGCGGG